MVANNNIILIINVKMTGLKSVLCSPEFLLFNVSSPDVFCCPVVH